MAVVVKTSDEIERMRVAGRLASEVLDFITPHVKPGVSTGKLNDLCHEYMVNVQKTIPAPLNYAPPGYKPYPKSICTSVNHQVSHGVPGDRVLGRPQIFPRRPGRRGSQAGKNSQYRRYRHQGRCPRRLQPHVLRGRA